MVNVGLSIKKLKAEKGVRSYQIAKSIGMNAKRFSVIENSNHATMKVIERLAAYFEISVWEFIKVGESK